MRNSQPQEHVTLSLAEQKKRETIFVAEVARIVTVNRKYGPVITAAGRSVFSETYFTLYYIE